MNCNCIELSRIVPYGSSEEQEQIRLNELQRTGILDSSPEDIDFDRLTNLASRFFKVQKMWCFRPRTWSNNNLRLLFLIIFSSTVAGSTSLNCRC